MNWRGERWQDQRFLAWLIRAAVFAVPIVAGVIAGTFTARRLPEPEGAAGVLGWWVLVIAASMGALFAVDRLARKLLPLAAMLRLALVFPDQAPSRFGVMLRANSTKKLERRVAEARADGIDDDPTRSSEYILALAANLNRHDRLTRGHAERTRAYTDLLAEELGLSPQEQDQLRWAALLHDIGKLEVPADVLNAGHGLEDEEWDRLKEHPTIGFEITRPIHDFLGDWAETIKHHHERWDGTGYPYGVERRDIAYGARIVAVADAYDAMTAFRTYQPAMSATDARMELADGAGSQFDPSVVRAFLSLSMGELRRIAGPLAMIGQLPFIGGLRRLGDAAGALLAALLVLGTVAVSAVGALGGDGTSLADLFADVNAEEVTVPVVVAAGDGTFDPTALDSDSVTVVEPPRFGSIVAGDGGQLEYEPGPDFPGSDQFTVQVCDADGDCALIALVVGGDGDVALADAVLSAQANAAGATSTTTTGGPASTSAPASSTAAPATVAPPASAAPASTTAAPTSTSTSTTATTTPTPTTRPVPPPPPPPPGAPVAAADNATTGEDQAVVVDVLANDTDRDGDLNVASLRIVTPPRRGTATLGGGRITYFPDANIHGTDTFTYEICDDDGRCDSARVTVTITSRNDPPVAAPNRATGKRLVPLVIDVLGNDSDVDGDALSIVAFDGKSTLRGRVTCDLTCTYTPPKIWPGPDTFTYTVADPSGARATATVTVTPDVADLGWTLTAGGSGDRVSSRVLPLVTGVIPAANATLPNLDTNRDALPGLLLEEVPTGIGTQFAETDPARYQLWLAPSGTQLSLAGPAELDLYAATSRMESGVRGHLRVFLLDCPATSTTGADCLEIAMASVDADPWSAVGGTWEIAGFDFGVVSHVIDADRALGLKLVVAGPESETDMRIAFDTVGLEAVFGVHP